jgi:hypothetical protein
VQFEVLLRDPDDVEVVEQEVRVAAVEEQIHVVTPHHLGCRDLVIAGGQDILRGHRIDEGRPLALRQAGDEGLQRLRRIVDAVVGVAG